MPDFFKNFFIKLKNKKNGFAENIKKHFVWENGLLKKLKKKNQTKSPTLKQLKYLPSLLTKDEKRFLIILGLIFIIALSVFLWRIYFRLPLMPAKGGEYIEGIIGKPEIINPLFSINDDAERDLTRLIFSGLFKWEGNQFVPDLVESWQEKNDGKNYIFHLKENIVWHDDADFSADDVVFTFGSIKNEKVKSPLREAFVRTEIKKIDNQTVEFILEKPSPFFISSLTLGILPQHLWQIVSPENFLADDLNLSPIGTGLFKLKEQIRIENGQIKKAVLERNKKHLPEAALLETITLKFFDDYESAFNALISKKIDGLSHTRKNSETETVLKNYAFYNIPLSYYSAIFFNQESNVLKNKGIRQALADVFNKEEILRDLQNIQPIKTAVINPEFKSEEINDYQYSPEAAEKKLAENGYKKKEAWFVNKDGSILEINLVVPEGITPGKIGQRTKDVWESFGIQVNLSILNKNDFSETIKENKYDAILSTVVKGYNADPFFFWHSTQKSEGFNLSNYNNIKVDFLLEKARNATNQDEKKEYYHEFQQIIYNDLPAIFLYQPDLVYLQDKKIKGFEISFLPCPADRFANIEDWYILTKRKIGR